MKSIDAYVLTQSYTFTAMCAHADTFAYAHAHLRQHPHAHAHRDTTVGCNATRRRPRGALPTLDVEFKRRVE